MIIINYNNWLIGSIREEKKKKKKNEKYDLLVGEEMNIERCDDYPPEVSYKIMNYDIHRGWLEISNWGKPCLRNGTVTSLPILIFHRQSMLCLTPPPTFFLMGCSFFSLGTQRLNLSTLK